jgi:copper chaperone
MRTFLKIEGLTGEDVATTVESALKAVEGVIDAEVSLEDAMASVLYDVRAEVAVLVAALKRAGYDARPI